MIEGYIYLALMLFLYFGPAIMARRRHHQNAPAIFLFNLLLGWTVLGWIIALVWAATAVDERRPA